MLYNLLAPLADEHIVFNLFRYLTFRAGAAVVTALVISFILGPWIIAWLKSKQGEGQPIREDGPESHLLTKKGKQMAFVTIEDFTGACDAVVFPSVYADVRDKLIPESVVFIQGKVDTEREPPSVLLDKLLDLSQAEGSLRVSVSAEMVVEETTPEMISSVRELLIQHRGSDPDGPQGVLSPRSASTNRSVSQFRIVRTSSGVT